MNRFRRSLKDERDVHSRLMQAYPEVPHAWYGALGLVSLGIGIAAIEIFPTQLPVWGFMFAILLSSLWSLPSGILQAMTNQMVHFTRMATLISGYLFPKKPVAHMICYYGRWASRPVLRRHETWALHEGSSSHHVLSPDHRSFHQLLRRHACSELDVREHRRLLRAHSEGRFRLSINQDVRYQFVDLG
jgi:hypothetical protein